jgi:hypothetical protein
MNFIEQANNLTTNKYFFYFILVLAGSNLLGYLSEKDWKGIVSFIMICGVMYYFTKNVVLILIVAIFGTSFLVSVLKNRQGMENMDEENDMDKLENVDSDLKNGIDALKKTDGDVSKAKEIIKKHSESKNKDNVVYPVQEQKDTEMEDNEMVTDDFNNNDFEPFSTYYQTSSYNYLDNAAVLDQDYDNLGENINEKLKRESKYLDAHRMNIHNSVSNMKPMLDTAGNMLTGIDFVKYGESIVEGASEFVAGLF